VHGKVSLYEDAVTRTIYPISTRLISLTKNKNNRNTTSSLCAYLASTPIDVGMRAYVEFAIRTKYRTLLELIAAAIIEEQEEEVLNRLSSSSSSSSSPLNDRIKFVCYEDLASANKSAVRDKADEAQYFLWGDSYEVQRNSRSGETMTAGSRGSSDSAASSSSSSSAYAGVHSTSHDPELRRKLVDIIADFDAKHYHGDIAWINRTLITCYP